MGRRSGGLGSWVGIGKMSLTLLAVAAMMALLASCGDTVYEAKGGPGGSSGVPTGTINISVKDGAGQTTFRNKADSVTVTLLNDPRNQGFPTSVLVDNGGVTFTGLVAGEYSVRISKPGYATSYIEGLTLENKQDYNDKNQDYYFLRTVTAVEPLYPLSAGLKGTLLYRKDDNTTGPAAGATVRIVIENEKLADNRNATVTTDANGTFTFDDLPATGDINYTVTALSKDFGSLLFVDSDLSDTYKKALRSGITTTLQTVTIYTTPVTGLRWTNAPISVEPEDAIAVEFNDEIEPASINSGSVTVRLDGTIPTLPRDVDVDGKTLTITPHGKWTGNLLVTFGTGLVAKNGGGVAGDLSIKIGVLTDGNELIVVNGDGSNVIWLADSTKPIELVFNKPIDKAKSVASTNFVNEPYSIEINEEKVTLSPAGAYWKSKTPTLTLTGFKSEDGKSYSASSQKIGETVVAITVNTISVGTPDFAVKKSGAWVEQTLNIGLADSAKTIELSLSDEIGAPEGGKTFRAYYIKNLPAAWSNSNPNLTFLSSEFTGSTIKLSANPRWLDSDSYIIIENVRSARGVKLKGGSEPTNGVEHTPAVPADPTATPPVVGAPAINFSSWSDDVAVVKISVLARRPFYVLTSAVAFPGEFGTTPIVVEFSEPVDSKFLSGRVTVKSYPSQYDPTASPLPTSNVTQLGDASVSGKIVTIKPLNGQTWMSQYLTVTFEAGSSANALQSTEGERLATTGATVYTTWSSATTDVSEIKVEKAWVFEEGGATDLRSSGAPNAKIKFVLAKNAAGERFGQNPDPTVTKKAGWAKGSYNVEVIAGGRVVNSVNFHDGSGTAWSPNRDTITLTVPNGPLGTETLGGRTLTYVVTPISGVSRGVSTAADGEVSGYLKLSATTIGGATYDYGVWDATWADPCPDPNPNNVNCTQTAISTAFANAFAHVRYMDQMVDNSSASGTPNYDKSQLKLANFVFDEEITEDLVSGSINWRNPRRVDYDALTVEVVKAADFSSSTPTKYSYDIYLKPNYTGTSWDDFVQSVYDEVAMTGTVVNGSDWTGTSPSATQNRFGTVKLNLTLSNIVNAGTGSVFGIAYENRRKVEIVNDISIDIQDMDLSGSVFLKTPANKP